MKEENSSLQSHLEYLQAQGLYWFLRKDGNYSAIDSFF